MDKAARLSASTRSRSAPQPGQDVSLHVGDRPRVRRGDLCRNHGHGVAAVGVPAFRARQGKRGPMVAISVSASRHFPSAPVTARRLRGARHGGDAGLGNRRDDDGSVRLHRSADRGSPHGQGLRTTLSQIIADELGTSPDRIKIVHGDTDRTPTAGAPSPAGRW
jgi:Aerobic-type carbon monoxide dehydrogenase, large subunit CoxL/CutL homologs